MAGASGFAALRVVGGGVNSGLLDASHGYEGAPPPQTLAAEAALRFVNSEVDFALGLGLGLGLGLSLGLGLGLGPSLGLGLGLG